MTLLSILLQAGENSKEIQEIDQALQGNLSLLIGGVALILAAVFVWFFLKKVVENSVIGLIVLAGIYLFFPEIFAKMWVIILPVVLLTLVFGPAGIGAVLLLIWLGVI